MRISYRLLSLGPVLLLTFAVRQRDLCAREVDHDHSARIEGTVLDSAGRPVSGARVFPFPLGVPIKGIQPEAYTGEDGHFSVSGLRAGVYRVTASKESEGYPDTAFSFYDTDHDLPEVKVALGEVVSGVEVLLGPKAATLEGVVLDEETGRPVKALISFFAKQSSAGSDDILEYGSLYSNEDFRHHGVPSPHGFAALVSSTKSFFVKVTAVGYDTWYYPDGGEAHATGLRMAPAETQNLTIYLRRLTPRNQ